jgi:hypothetical protein
MQPLNGPRVCGVWDEAESTERDQLNESARGRNQAKNMRSIFFDNPGPDARYS